LFVTRIPNSVSWPAASGLVLVLVLVLEVTPEQAATIAVLIPFLASLGRRSPKVPEMGEHHGEPGLISELAALLRDRPGGTAPVGTPAEWMERKEDLLRRIEAIEASAGQR
jgi:hypothetical protein